MNEKLLIDIVINEDWGKSLDIYKSYVDKELEDVYKDIQQKYNVYPAITVDSYAMKLTAANGIVVFNYSQHCSFTKKFDIFDENKEQIISNIYLSFIAAQQNIEENKEKFEKLKNEILDYHIFQKDKLKVNYEMDNKLSNNISKFHIVYPPIFDIEQRYCATIYQSLSKLEEDLKRYCYHHFLIDSVQYILLEEKNAKTFDEEDYYTILKLLDNDRYMSSLRASWRVPTNKRALLRILNSTDYLPEFFKKRITSMSLLEEIDCGL